MIIKPLVNERKFFELRKYSEFHYWLFSIQFYELKNIV